MKKNILAFLLLLLVAAQASAQKELWGINTGDEYVNPASYYGNITKYDINGENPVLMHEFDSIHGYIPKGKLFLASNGKLYGTTSKGGNIGPIGSNTTAGVLFEYDLILDQYRVVHYFQYGNPIATSPNIGVIEPIPGQLYGATADYIYKYDLATEATTFYNSVGFNNSIHGELMKASNGNLYGTSYYGNCPNSSSSPTLNGCIIKFNMATNLLSIVSTFDCDYTIEGLAPWRQLVEVSPGKLIGLTKAGGIHGQSNPAGTLFEFDTNSNLLTKKIDFDAAIIGATPIALVDGGNGKVYGLCESDGAPQACNPDYRFGTLYEYTPTANALEVKQSFSYCGNTVKNPSSLMKTSNGYFMGTIPGGGLFKYDAMANTVTMPNYTNSDINLYNAANLIEICRKPSYHYFDPDTYTVCESNPFTFDVQNTNATGYVWKKDGIVVPNQTTGILSLASVALTDAGDYTCEMANECGTTVTMPLHLIVDCLGVDESIGLNAIALYPNPAHTALNIKLPETKNFTIREITISNMLGQTVLNALKNETAIDVGFLENGIYILKIKTDKGDWNGKFIKE